MNYYYLIASLPMLRIDAPPPFTTTEFQSLCRDYLTPEDFEALEAILNSKIEDSTHPFVQEWRNRDTQIRNAVVRQRASNLKQDPTPHLREQEGFSAHVDKLAGDAFSKGSPLDREQALDALRWDSIDELAGLDPFTGRAVLAYTLKLLLAQRWAQMNEDKGKQLGNDIVNRDSNRNEEETNDE